MKILKERRRYSRYSIKDGSYVTISPKAEKFGPIMDMSMGGLVFKYFDKDTITNNCNTQETLFLSSENNFVGGISFKTIADYELSEDKTLNQSYPKKGKMRIRRVKFTNLILKQLFDLDHFIGENTIDQNGFIAVN